MFGRIRIGNEYSRLDEMALLAYLKLWWVEHEGCYNNRTLRASLSEKILKFTRTNLPEIKQTNTLVGVDCSESLNPPNIIEDGSIAIRIIYANEKKTMSYKILLPEDFDRIKLPSSVGLFPIVILGTSQSGCARLSINTLGASMR